MADDQGAPKGAHYYKNKKKKAKKLAKNMLPKPEKRSTVDKETADYFRQVNGLMDADDFDTVEDREMFLENVFEQTKGNELRLAQDQECSEILENLLRKGPSSHVLALLRAFSGNYSTVARDRFGSHVLQTALSLLQNLLLNEAATGESGGDTAEQIFLDMCTELDREWYTLSENQYGSHVVRVIVGLASGGALPSELIRSERSWGFRGRKEGEKKQAKEELQSYHAPKSFGRVLKNIANAMVEKKYLSDDVRSLPMSGVLQSLLLALDKKWPKLKRKLLLRILNQPDVEAETLAPMNAASIRMTLIEDQTGSRLMEVVLKVADPDVYNALYREVFRGNLVEFSKAPVANYVVQQLLSNATDETGVALMVDELTDHLESFLAHGHVGVVIKVVEASQKAHEQPPKLQKKVVKALYSSFHLKEAEDMREVVPVILRLMALESYKEVKEKGLEEMPLKLHGALLLQSLFKLDSHLVTPFVISLLNLGVEGILSLCLHPIGSHVIEGFLKGTADFNLKKRFVKKLKGNFAKLAMDRHGSYTVDACWACVDVKTKEWIANELLAKESDLASNPYGRKVMFNCRLNHIKRTKERWIDAEKTNERRVAMFADILEDSPAAPPAKKGKNSSDKKSTGKRKRPTDEIDELFSLRA